MVHSSDRKPSYPAGVTTEKENWASWAKAWWAFNKDVQQRRTFSPYGEHKSLAWLLFLHSSWETASFVPQRQGYCITSLSVLSQLNCSGIEINCSASSALPDVGRCNAHTLPARLDVKQFQQPSSGSSWHNAADWLWFLKPLQKWPQLMTVP